MDRLSAILDLYRRSFPPSERRSDDAIIASIRSPNYQTFTAFAGESLSAFALVYTPPAEAFVLLEYLAVDPIHRSIGVGSRLFHDIVEATANRHLLIEVEAKTFGNEAVRRQRFYERLGCQRIVGLKYLLPLPNSPPMELMIRRLDESPIQLERWLRQIYSGVYECAATDPRIQWMLDDFDAASQP